MSNYTRSVTFCKTRNGNRHAMFPSWHEDWELPSRELYSFSFIHHFLHQQFFSLSHSSSCLSVSTNPLRHVWGRTRKAIHKRNSRLACGTWRHATWHLPNYTASHNIFIVTAMITQNLINIHTAYNFKLTGNVWVHQSFGLSDYWNGRCSPD